MTMTLLRYVGRNTNFNDAMRILEAITTSPAATPASMSSNQDNGPGLEDDGSDLATLKTKIIGLNRDYEQLNSLVSKMLEESTRQNLEGLKDSISEAAVSYRTAYDMTTFYTKEWFSRLFMTIDGKQDLALHLMNAVKPYGVQNTGTWEAIINENPDVLEFISTPHNDM